MTLSENYLCPQLYNMGLGNNAWENPHKAESDDACVDIKYQVFKCSKIDHLVTVQLETSTTFP